MHMANRNRTFILGGIFVLLILGIGAWTIFHQSAPATSLPASAATLSITALRTDVFVKSSDGGEFAKIEGSATTSSGATIRTSSTGRALIETQGTHATLVDYSSEITLAQEDGNRTRVELISGGVWSRIQKVLDSGEYYEITTQNAVAAVRGTSFSMSSVASTTTLIVADGTVVFSEIDANGASLPATLVLVPAGKKAVRVGSGKIVVSDITPADKATSWYEFNNPENKPAPGSVPSPAVGVPGAASGVPAQPSTPTSSPPQTTVPPTGATTPPAEPHLSSVAPASISEGSQERIVLRGSDLQDVAQLKLNGQSIRFRIESDSKITFTASDLEPGTYSILVVTKSNYRDQLSNALTIIDPNASQTAGTTYNPNYSY